MKKSNFLPSPLPAIPTAIEASLNAQLAFKAINAHREAAWAMDAERDGILRPALLNYGPAGPTHSAMRGGKHMSERTRASEQAERQMAEAQKLWEAYATEESWAERKVTDINSVEGAQHIASCSNCKHQARYYF